MILPNESQLNQAGLLIRDLDAIVRRHAASYDGDRFSRDVDAAVGYFVSEFDLSREDIRGLLRAYAKWQLLRAMADIIGK
jgi:CBS-domain-containing membrane protein